MSEVEVRTPKTRASRAYLAQAVVAQMVARNALYRAEAAQRLVMLACEEIVIRADLAEAQKAYDDARRAANDRLEALEEVAFGVLDDTYAQARENAERCDAGDDYGATVRQTWDFMGALAAQGLVPLDWWKHSDDMEGGYEYDEAALAEQWLGLPLVVGRWVERAHRPCSACHQSVGPSPALLTWAGVR